MRKIIFITIPLILLGIIILWAFTFFKTAEKYTPNTVSPSEKVNGISFVAPVNEIDVSSLKSLVDINANWIAFSPFAYTQGNSPAINFNVEWQWWGEKLIGLKKCIAFAKQHKLKVMLKPQVWIIGQGWPGEFELKNEAEWKLWEANYSKYIITMVKIAAESDLELFCIGTEYKIAATKRPQFWRDLILNVHKVYSGKIIYAANWDNYENIEFWDDLDYIGIDAYFPLSNEKTPSISTLSEKWRDIKNDIQSYANKEKKNVIFTEYGYRNVDQCTFEPWRDDLQTAQKINNLAQVNAFEAIYKSIWHEPWFAGGFIWKWYDYHESAGGNDNHDFTPQNKPAEKVIEKWYGKY